MGSKIEACSGVNNDQCKFDRQLSEGFKGLEGQVLAQAARTIEEGTAGCDGTGPISLPSPDNKQNTPLLLLQPPPTLPHSSSQQSQPPSGLVVRWERFLPVKSLKVLLVENDDSTRHIVSALLRNCSYEVTSAANGLEAWKFLEVFDHHVDLILSEVSMPGLSGIGLLSKIMSHRTHKNIPVIMMSSHDSMGIVFKCLSKGAVDFLVKPIRKNELKNLWQHVWRRCHSSSGSESGIQAHRSAKSMSMDESDCSSRSSDDDGDSSVGLNARSRSDTGSGTQSSWTKQAAEVESPRQSSEQDHQLGDPHDSTCAQDIHPKTETFCDKWVLSGSKWYNEKEIIDDGALGRDLERRVLKDGCLQDECFSRERVHPSITGTSMEFVTEETMKCGQDHNRICLLEQESMQGICNTSTHAAGFIGAISSAINSRIPSKSSKASNDAPEVLSSNDKAVDGTKELPSLELSLNRLISVGDGVTVPNDRNILRHSDQSAFSRYNISASSSQIPTTFEETNEDIKVGSKSLIRPPPLKEKSDTLSTVKGANLSAFEPVRPSCAEVVQERTDDFETSATIVHPKGIRVQVEHHHHHYHHHHIHGMQPQSPAQHSRDQEGYTLKNITSAVPQCGSSNILGGQIECNTANYSVNGSVSGSNHGSNVLNGSSTAAIAIGMHPEDSGAAVKSGGEDINGIGTRSGSAIDPNRILQREAALNKFRQKRKERCFDKKVRYQSRKKLAEQRPRLRGQFVRQATLEQRGLDDAR